MSLGCDKARQLMSLRLDDELSEIEGWHLDDHLDNCESCRRWHLGIGATTLLLREAEPERPAKRVRPPRTNRRRRTVWRGVAVAAVVAAAALGSVLGALVSQTEEPVQPQAPQIGFLPRDFTPETPPIEPEPNPPLPEVPADSPV